MIPENIPLYRDGRHYDALHRSLPFNDTPFYLAESKSAKGPVLEIGCGTGRLTIPIAQSGVEIVGLDLSASMLSHARNKATEAGLDIEWVEADGRDVNLGRKFGLIFMPFNSMQHLHDASSLASLFANVKKHLADGGRFIFDVFNPSIAVLNRDPGVRHVERQYEDPHSRGTVTVEQSAVYDEAAQVNRITLYFSLPSQKDFFVGPLHMRCFFPQELDALVVAHGFQIENKFGSFERSPFASGSTKQIVMCRLP